MSNSAVAVQTIVVLVDDGSGFKVVASGDINADSVAEVVETVENGTY